MLRANRGNIVSWNRCTALISNSNTYLRSLNSSLCLKIASFKASSASKIEDSTSKDGRPSDSKESSTKAKESKKNTKEIRAAYKKDQARGTIAIADTAEKEAPSGPAPKYAKGNREQREANE